MARPALAVAGRPALAAAGKPALAALVLSSVVACGGGALDEARRAERLEEMVEEVERDFPDVATVTSEELARLLADSGRVVLVDVRTIEERMVSIIPGAISREEFLQEYDRSDGRPVVAYCTVGVRSSRFAREMADLGISVSNLEGSVLSWTHHGGSLERAGRPTDTVHVRARGWALSADGYEEVW